MKAVNEKTYRIKGKKHKESKKNFFYYITVPSKRYFIH